MIPTIDLTAFSEEFFSAAPAIDLQDGVLSRPLHHAYLKMTRSRTSYCHQFAKLGQILANNAAAYGVAKVKTNPHRGIPQSARLSIATAICSQVATPIRVIDRLPLWQPIEVDFAAEPHRFGGVGYNPLHVDVVNATHPPNYVALYCERPDPDGGGVNLTSNLLDGLSRLSDSDRALLSHTLVQEGRFYGMSHVGTELNPFPILDESTSPLPTIRFTAKLLAENRQFPGLDLLLRFNEILEAGKIRCGLDAGDILIVNQRIAAHGREPLSPRQASIPEQERRLLHQLFLSPDARGASAWNN